MKYFVISCCIVFVIVSVYLDGLLYILGPNYRAGKYVVPVLLLANLCLGISYNLSIGFKITDKLLGASWVSVVAAGITIILNILFIPVFGFYASAVTTLVAYAFMALVYFFLSGKHYHVPYKTGNMLFHIITSSILVLMFLLFQYFLKWNLPLSLISGSLLIGLYLFIIYYADKELKHLIQSLTKKIQARFF